MTGWERVGMLAGRFVARASVWTASGFTGALGSGNRLHWGEAWHVALKGKRCFKHAHSKRWRDF